MNNRNNMREGIQPDGTKGVQPTRGNLDRSKPPDGGSGVSSDSSNNSNNSSNSNSNNTSSD